MDKVDKARLPTDSGLNKSNESKSAEPDHQTFPARDRSIDVLRGLTCLSMVLVNSASTPRPGWLSHAARIDEPITFADTLFPCFLFTSGLAEASSGGLSRSRGFQRVLWRSIKLSLLGIGYNNILPRLLGASDQPLLEVSTYRIPSVLGRLGIASVVGALEPHLKLPPPLFPALLGAFWYFISRRHPLHPLASSVQARLDLILFGSSHLYDSRHGFDPEGTFSSLLTAPMSLIIGRYAAHPSLFWTSETSLPAVLGGFAVLAVLLTGVLPSPSFKPLWTPTFVGQTTALSCLYWFLARGLAAYGGFVADACEVVGQRTLEVYLVSAAAQMGLDTIGAWASIGCGLSNWLGLDEVWTGIARSGLLAIAMVPVAKVWVKWGWRLMR